MPLPAPAQEAKISRLTEAISGDGDKPHQDFFCHKLFGFSRIF